ncbi:MAG: hypothetical protein Q4B91_07000 [Atopobiaceae bacterium]|nr:hypothetical protein [Atopobiaceae bacterium]
MAKRDEARSEFADKSAEEVARAYLGWFGRTRACCAAAAIIVGIAAIVSLFVVDSLVLYLLGLAALVGIGIWIRVCVNREFRRLLAIINTDCDVEKWRGVIGRIREHGLRRRRSRALCDCYLALADLEDEPPSAALARMEGLDFGRRGILNVVLFQNRAVCAHELGDAAAQEESVGALRALVDGLRAGSKKRAVAEQQLEDVVLTLKPHESWDADDEALARERLAAASTHREHVSWALHVAQCEILSGNVAAAQKLLDEKDLTPMTPRAAQRRATLLARLP